MNVTPSSRGETRTGFFDSPVIGRKADSPTKRSQRLHLEENCALTLDPVFIATPTS